MTEVVIVESMAYSCAVSEGNRIHLHQVFAVKTPDPGRTAVPLRPARRQRGGRLRHLSGVPPTQ